MTKETVQDYGVRLNAADFDVTDADAPEYIVVRGLNEVAAESAEARQFSE